MPSSAAILFGLTRRIAWVDQDKKSLAEKGMSSRDLRPIGICFDAGFRFRIESGSALLICTARCHASGAEVFGNSWINSFSKSAVISMVSPKKKSPQNLAFPDAAGDGE